MSITVVQAASAQVANGATDSSVTVTLTNPTRSGNLLVAIGVDNQGLNATEAATPFQDNGSNTWQAAVPTNDGQYAVANRFTQRFAAAITGRSGHTMTYTTTGLFFPSIAVVELAGAVMGTPLDKMANNHGLAVNLNPRSSGNTGQTLFPVEIAVAGMTHGGGSNETFASNNGYTIQTSQTNTSKMPIVLATLTLSDFGTAGDAYNLTPNTATSWAAGIATYVAAATAAVTYGFAAT
jgi:hypothetical protein